MQAYTEFLDSKYRKSLFFKKENDTDHAPGVSTQGDEESMHPDNGITASTGGGDEEDANVGTDGANDEDNGNDGNLRGHGGGNEQDAEVREDQEGDDEGGGDKLSGILAQLYMLNPGQGYRCCNTLSSPHPSCT